MAKKDFKQNIAKGSDRFFSVLDEPQERTHDTQETHNTQRTHGTHSTQGTHRTHDTHSTPFRINLKLKGEYQDYLKQRAWETRKSVTQYINDLIQADIDRKDT